MSHVSTDEISRHLKHSGPKFHDPNQIDVGQGQTYTYGGIGRGLTFDVHGTNSYQHFANAHLDLTYQGPGFVGQIKLGQFADIKLEGMHATSYIFDKARGDLKLFQQNTLVDELKIDTDGKGISVANFPVSAGSHGSVLISTGSLPMGIGAQFAIGPHTGSVFTG